MSSQTSLKASNGKYWSVDPDSNKVMPNGTDITQTQCQFMVDLLHFTIFSVAANMYVMPDAGGLFASSEHKYPWWSIDGKAGGGPFLTWIQINFDDSNGIILSNDSLIIGHISQGGGTLTSDPNAQFICDPPLPG